MSKLSAEAYAIVEGRHADPFHYLGMHTEGDRTVVRAFLPEASNVEAIGEHGDKPITDKVEAKSRAMAKGPIADAYNGMLATVQEEVDVHRTVLAWRAWARP